MLKVLIIYPHWPPSNLAGVHRARLTANALVKLGHDISVLTVDEAFYEEKPDSDLAKTVHAKITVYKTQAKKVSKPRLFGDIGLRAYKLLKVQALELLKFQNFDFVWIPIPSFYTALLGPYLKRKTGVAYGIDYIDPWLRDISGRANLRAKLSNVVAKFLEPKALKTVDIVSGVAEGYYMPALKRTFKKGNYPVTVAFPYGYDADDYKHTVKTNLPWDRSEQAIVYAGAFLPNSGVFLEALCKVLQPNLETIERQKIKFYFLGTGNYPHKGVTAYANEFGLNTIIKEIPERRPYLDILNCLKSASGILVLGSTEAHYTASKVFQALLAERPILSVFHTESSAAELLSQTAHAATLQQWAPTLTEFETQLNAKLFAFLPQLNFKVEKPAILEQYQTTHGAKLLVNAIEGLKKE